MRGCRECAATGAIDVDGGMQTAPCPRCGGTGRVPDEADLRAERDALAAELDRMTEALARRLAAGDYDADPVWYRHEARRLARRVADLAAPAEGEKGE